MARLRVIVPFDPWGTFQQDEDMLTHCIADTGVPMGDTSAARESWLLNYGSQFLRAEGVHHLQSIITTLVNEIDATANTTTDGGDKKEGSSDGIDRGSGSLHDDDDDDDDDYDGGDSIADASFGHVQRDHGGLELAYVGQTSQRPADRLASHLHPDNTSVVGCIATGLRQQPVRMAVLLEIDKSDVAALVELNISPTVARMRSEAIVMAVLLTRSRTRQQIQLTRTSFGLNIAGGGEHFEDARPLFKVYASDAVLGELRVAFTTTYTDLVRQGIPPR
eukprot:g3316.t1